MAISIKLKHDKAIPKSSLHYILKKSATKLVEASTQVDEEWSKPFNEKEFCELASFNNERLINNYPDKHEAVKSSLSSYKNTTPNNKCREEINKPLKADKEYLFNDKAFHPAIQYKKLARENINAVQNTPPRMTHNLLYGSEANSQNFNLNVQGSLNKNVLLEHADLNFPLRFYKKTNIVGYNSVVNSILNKDKLPQVTGRVIKPPLKDSLKHCRSVKKKFYNIYSERLNKDNRLKANDKHLFEMLLSTISKLASTRSNDERLNVYKNLSAKDKYNSITKTIHSISMLLSTKQRKQYNNSPNRSFEGLKRPKKALHRYSAINRIFSIRKAF